MRQILVLALSLLGVLPAISAERAAGGERENKRLIVGFRAESGAAQRDAVLRRFDLLEVEDIDELNLTVVEARAGGFSPAAMRLMSDPSVYLVEEDFYINWLNETAPSFHAMPLPSLGAVMGNLPKFEQKTAAKGEMPWGVVRVNAEGAWERGQGRGVRVAVIDTGVDCTHPDLAANCAAGYNAVDSDKPPADDHGHGTHVSGTIAAVKDGKGVVGVAPGAVIVPVKVLDKDGGGSLTSIIKGLIWVGRNNIAVANMSLGSPMGSIFMRGAVMYAKSKGVTIVAAAGNSGGSVGYPAAYSETIAVSASDSDDGLADFSSRGEEVDFIAPGVEVNSTLPGGKYGRYSGTSMATPHVAGLAALAVGQGAKGVDGVRGMLKNAAKPIAGLDAKQQGAGMVDAGNIRKR